jgi:hypothetical protein
VHLAAALSAVLALAAGPKATLTAPTHTPATGAHWNYVLRVTQDGKPVRARISAQIVDPIGGKHPVEFGATTKTITNWPIRGVFRDYVIWPASSRGVPLTFRLIVVVGSTRRTIDYVVTPHA